MQRFEAVGQLVAGVAHDFNNILTVMMGAVELALRGTDIAQRSRRHLRGLHAGCAARRANHQAAAGFARRQVLRPEGVNLNEVIANLDSFIARAEAENVQVTTKLSPVLWPARVIERNSRPHW